MAAIASTTTSTTLLEHATTRIRSSVIVENTDANRLYVLIGSGTASSSDYSFSLAQNENALLPDFQGELTGVWAADGTGSAMVTEY